LYDAANVAIEDNKIVNNRGAISVTLPTIPAGVLIHGQDGVAVEFSRAVSIRENEISGNSGPGMRLRVSEDVSASANRVEHNDQYGILVWGIPGVELDENTVTGHHGASAVNVGNSPGAQITGNHVVDNAVFAAIGIGQGSNGARA